MEKMFEISLDKLSKINKIVEFRKKALYQNGVEKMYIKDSTTGKMIKKESETLTKHYYFPFSLELDNSIAELTDLIGSSNYVIVMYAEIKNNLTGMVIDKEWYIAINSQSFFEHIYQTLEGEIPTGRYYQLFTKNPQSNRINKFCSTTYPFGLSIKKMQDSTYSLEWYMNISETEAIPIMNSFKNQ